MFVGNKVDNHNVKTQGGKILNFHVSDEEKAFIERLAKMFAMTQTMVIRNLIREEMKRMAKK